MQGAGYGRIIGVVLAPVASCVAVNCEKMVDAGRMLGKATRELRRLSAELPALIDDDEAGRRGFQPRQVHAYPSFYRGSE